MQRPLPGDEGIAAGMRARFGRPEHRARVLVHDHAAAVGEGAQSGDVLAADGVGRIGLGGDVEPVRPPLWVARAHDVERALQPDGDGARHRRGGLDLVAVLGSGRKPVHGPEELVGQVEVQTGHEHRHQHRQQIHAREVVQIEHEACARGAALEAQRAAPLAVLRPPQVDADAQRHQRCQCHDAHDRSADLPGQQQLVVQFEDEREEIARKPGVMRLDEPRSEYLRGVGIDEHLPAIRFVCNRYLGRQPVAPRIGAGIEAEVDFGTLGQRGARRRFDFGQRAVGRRSARLRRHGEERRMEHLLDFVVEHQQRAGQADQREPEPQREAQPQMQFEPQRAHQNSSLMRAMKVRGSPT